MPGPTGGANSSWRNNPPGGPDRTHALYPRHRDQPLRRGDSPASAAGVPGSGLRGRAGPSCLGGSLPGRRAVQGPARSLRPVRRDPPRLARGGLRLPGRDARRGGGGVGAGETGRWSTRGWAVRRGRCTPGPTLAARARRPGPGGVARAVARCRGRPADADPSGVRGRARSARPAAPLAVGAPPHLLRRTLRAISPRTATQRASPSIHGLWPLPAHGRRLYACGCRGDGPLDVRRRRPWTTRCASRSRCSAMA
jgi:hypothetical protein